MIATYGCVWKKSVILLFRIYYIKEREALHVF